MENLTKDIEISESEFLKSFNNDFNNYIDIKIAKLRKICEVVLHLINNAVLKGEQEYVAVGKIERRIYSIQRDIIGFIEPEKKYETTTEFHMCYYSNNILKQMLSEKKESFNRKYKRWFTDCFESIEINTNRLDNIELKLNILKEIDSMRDIFKDRSK